jgi:hypothetical protein
VRYLLLLLCSGCATAPVQKPLLMPPVGMAAEQRSNDVWILRPFEARDYWLGELAKSQRRVDVCQRLLNAALDNELFVMMKLRELDP